MFNYILNLSDTISNSDCGWKEMMMMTKSLVIGKIDQRNTSSAMLPFRAQVQVRHHRQTLEMEVETQQLSELQDCLMKLSSVLLNEDRDTWVWLGDDTGLYTVSSLQKLYIKDRISNFFQKMIWCKWIPVKCNIFVWRAEANRISTFSAVEKVTSFWIQTCAPYVKVKWSLPNIFSFHARSRIQSGVAYYARFLLGLPYFENSLRWTKSTRKC